MSAADEPFLEAVNRTLTGARLDEVRFQRYSGSLQFGGDYGAVSVTWSGWLALGPLPQTAEEDEEFHTAPIIGPFIGCELSAIRKQGDHYVLDFTDGRSLFAGNWKDDKVSDNILLVTAKSEEAPIIWGLLD